MLAFVKSKSNEIYVGCCTLDQRVCECVASGGCVGEMRCGVVRYFGCTSYLRYLVLYGPVCCVSVTLTLQIIFKHSLTCLNDGVSFESTKYRKIYSSLSYCFSNKYLLTNINIGLIIFILKVFDIIFDMQSGDLVTHVRVAPICGARTIHNVFLTSAFESVPAYPLRSLIITDWLSYIDIYLIMLKMNQPTYNNIIINVNYILFLVMSCQLCITTYRQLCPFYTDYLGMFLVGVIYNNAAP